MDGIVGRLLLVHDAIHWLGSLAWYIRLPAVLYHSEGLWAGNVLWLLGSPTSTGGAGEQGILAIPWAPGDERTDSGSQQVRSILNPGLTANWIFLQLTFIPEPISQTKCLPYEIPLKQHICNTRCLPDQISRHPDNSQKKSNSRYSPCYFPELLISSGRQVPHLLRPHGLPPHSLPPAYSGGGLTGTGSIHGICPTLPSTSSNPRPRYSRATRSTSTPATMNTIGVGPPSSYMATHEVA